MIKKMEKVNNRVHIGDILVQNGVISEEQLQKTRMIQNGNSDYSTHKFIQILYQDLDMDYDELMKAVSDIYVLREFQLSEEELTDEYIGNIKRLLDTFSDSDINEFLSLDALPVEHQHKTLIIATADPTDARLVELLTRLSINHFELVYCRRNTLRELVEKVLYTKNDILQELEDVQITESEIEEAATEEINEEEIDREINQSMLNKLVEGMFIQAVREGASDIHVVPVNSFTTDIRFRTDGKLNLWHQQKKVRPEALVAVVKDKARNVDRFERDRSQDGFIQRKVDNVNIRYRVSIMPIVGTEFGKKFESVVIRVLDDRKVITDLNKLGLQDHALKLFTKAINKPSGMVIMTGPTGSGKSTSLVAALHHVMDPSKNVLTVEDPTEYIIAGARQLKISSKMTFDQSMRGILRHDPDIVLVGEIRDLNTAEIAIKLANTGHLTFSTLHTNDAPSAISRLYKMGVEPFLIANAVNLIMAQRLVRKLCDHCKIEMTNKHPEVARSLGFTDAEIEESVFHRANELGCKHCTHGYKGRLAIIEALYFTPEIRSLILDAGSNIDEEEIRSWAIEHGMMTLRASGRERIKEGTTSFDEVLSMTVED